MKMAMKWALQVRESGHWVGRIDGAYAIVPLGMRTFFGQKEAHGLQKRLASEFGPLDVLVFRSNVSLETKEQAPAMKVPPKSKTLPKVKGPSRKGVHDVFVAAVAYGNAIAAMAEPPFPEGKDRDEKTIAIGRASADLMEALKPFIKPFGALKPKK